MDQVKVADKTLMRLFQTEKELILMQVKLDAQLLENQNLKKELENLKNSTGLKEGDNNEAIREN